MEKHLKKLVKKFHIKLIEFIKNKNIKNRID